MSAITQDEWELINQISSEFHGIREYTLARRRFLQSLKKLIDFDLADYCLASNKHSGGLTLTEPVVVSRFSKEFEDAFTEKYESHYGELDYTRWFFTNKESVVYRESDVIQNEIRQKTPYYQEYLKPMDLIHVAGISISGDGVSFGVLALYRKSNKPDFSDHDLLLLEKLLPHLSSRMQLEYDLTSKTQTELSYSAYLSRKYGVTRRESQLMELILHGKNNEEIAGSLMITQNTVKKHIGHLFQKLQVTNRVQLIHKVIEEEGVECQIF